VLGIAAGAFSRFLCPKTHKIPRMAEYPAPIPNAMAKTTVATNVPEVMTVLTVPFPKSFDAHLFVADAS